MATLRTAALVVLLVSLREAACGSEVVATRREQQIARQPSVGGIAMVDALLVVGSPSANSATVYENSGNRTWRVVDVLVPPADDGATTLFGAAVALAWEVGSRALCAVAGQQASGGAVFFYRADSYTAWWSYVSQQNATTWLQYYQRYTPWYDPPLRVPVETERFGASVAWSPKGDTLVVGAPVTSGTGSVFVYETSTYDGDVRRLRGHLIGETPGFGSAVAVKGTDLVVVSDPFASTVWVFKSAGIDWERTQVLSAAWWGPRLRSCESFFFGASLALSHKSPYLLVGCGKDTIQNGTTAVLRTYDGGATWGLHQELEKFGSDVAFAGPSDNNVVVGGDGGASFFRKNDDEQAWTWVQDLPQGRARLAATDFQFVVADSQDAVTTVRGYAFETCDLFQISPVAYVLGRWDTYPQGWGYPGQVVEVPEDDYLCLPDACYWLRFINVTWARVRFGGYEFQFAGAGGAVVDFETNFVVADGAVDFAVSSCSLPRGGAPTSYPTVLATEAPKKKKKDTKSGLSDGGIAALVASAVVVAVAFAVLAAQLLQFFLTSRRTAEVPVAPAKGETKSTAVNEQHHHSDEEAKGEKSTVNEQQNTDDAATTGVEMK